MKEIIRSRRSILMPAIWVLVDQLWMVSELQAVREILFMLLGCPCSIFEVGRRTLATGKDPVVVWVDASKLKKQRFALRHSSFEAFVSILTWFAERGTAVNRIREFIKRKELLPARQSFLAALAGSLSRLNKTLAEQQSWLVETGQSKSLPYTSYIYFGK